MTNILLDKWTTPFDLPPFDEISDQDFKPALDEALDRARARLNAIVENPDPPSFENTIEALELLSPELDNVLGPFFLLASVDSTSERENLQLEFSPLLSAYSSEISMNADLFERIENLWGRREELGLNEEQKRVLYLTHRGFVRSGARLTGQESDRLKEVKSRLAILGTQFSQNILADERSWYMELSEDQLDGLPDFLLSAAREAAKEKQLDGWVITLSRSLVVPFLQYSTQRPLRKKAYEAWTARGANGGKTDNREIAAEILQLRKERAELLGYKDFASYKLETEMAKSPDRVEDLLMSVWKPAKKQAAKDAAILQSYLEERGNQGRLEPWDWRFYSEIRKGKEHDLDEAALKPYLQLENMIEAAFDCANRLFGLEFENSDVVLHHPDARCWEVSRDGKQMAIFVADYFARSGKRSGAWCGGLRSQQRLAGDIRPVVTNVCNFAKPAEGEPALLSYDDARTLFHEFGHALHNMLSDVTYESISGTSVSRDFVELPSQLFEHWLEVPEVLEKFALHSETGKPIPPEMLEKLLNAMTYDQGFATVEYVASALVDLDFHTGNPPSDPMQRQQQVLDSLGMPSEIRMRHATPHFAHVFSGDGYSAGYYSYMWSEVMDADAFEAFEEKGNAFDPTIAESLEKNILSSGGSKDAEELYRAFRGRLPGVEALLKGRGLDAV